MSNALWCNRQISVRVEGPDGEWTVDVGKPFARIGSDARSDVILDGAGLPRLSHYLHATERGIFVKPLVAMLDGHETRGRWLSPDCAVEVGAYRFFASFTDGVPPVAGLWPPLDEKGSAELPVPVIYILVNEARRATYRAYRKLTVVGREKPTRLAAGKSAHFVNALCAVLGPGQAVVCGLVKRQWHGAARQAARRGSVVVGTHDQTGRRAIGPGSHVRRDVGGIARSRDGPDGAAIERSGASWSGDRVGSGGFGFAA